MEGSTVDNCIFCKIIQGKTETKLLYEDDDFIVFSDIKPASKYHYLIVPKKHIPDAKSLTKDQIHIGNKSSMIDMMWPMSVDIAKQVLGDNGANLDDIRFGFHWPPFHSVHHLHLHAISPTDGMGFFGRLIFKPNSWWFVS
ncbi:hypothetical protein J437_LFUL006504, partial [Ladona fulva]